LGDRQDGERPAFLEQLPGGPHEQVTRARGRPGRLRFPGHRNVPLDTCALCRNDTPVAICDNCLILEEHTMTVLATSRSEIGPDFYDLVVEQLAPHLRGADGFRGHFAGADPDGGWTVIEVWDSAEQQAAF